MGVHLPEETGPLAAAVDRTLDPHGLSKSQEDRAFVRDRFVLPVRSGGGGFPPTVKRA